MKNLVRFLGILVVIILAVTQAKAQWAWPLDGTEPPPPLASDTFNYSDGELVTVSSGTWASFSGTTALNVSSGQAVLTGANSMDDQITLSGGPHSSDAIFASFDLTVSALPAVNQGAYFALFKDSATTFLCKAFVTNVAGQVQLGITTQANNPALGALWGTTYAVGTTHKIVIELDQTAGWPAEATMWVDPVGPASTSITAADNPFATNANIVAFALRQSNAQQGTQLIDNLLIWSQVPEPSTIVLLGVSLISLLAIRRRS